MRRRYLCDILRAMRYYARSSWGEGKPDEYSLQVIDTSRMIYSKHGALTDLELIKGAKSTGVPIYGQHWADYMTPENALEKRMMDDAITFAKIVKGLVTVESIESLGYSKAEAKRILRDATYITGDDE